ncbi:MAG: hypothetical protein ACTSRG_21240 [Candidatus Helarchaeota archaeon]
MKFPINGNIRIISTYEMGEITFSPKYNKPGIVEIKNIGINPPNTFSSRAAYPIEKILNLLSFSSGIGVELDYYHLGRLEMGAEPGAHSTGIYSYTPFSKKQMDVIRKLTENFQRLISAEERKKLEFQLRFYRKGLYADKIVDQFLYFWIVLESLVGGKERINEVAYKEVRKVIICALKKKSIAGNPYASIIISRIDDCIYEPMLKKMVSGIREVYQETFRKDFIPEEIREEAVLTQKIKEIKNIRNNLVHGTGYDDLQLKNETQFIRGMIKTILTSRLLRIYTEFVGDFPSITLLEEVRGGQGLFCGTHRMELRTLFYVFREKGPEIEENELFFLLYPFFKSYKELRRFFSDVIPFFIENGCLTEREESGRKIFQSQIPEGHIRLT